MIRYRFVVLSNLVEAIDDADEVACFGLPFQDFWPLRITMHLTFCRNNSSINKDALRVAALPLLSTDIVRWIQGASTVDGSNVNGDPFPD